MDNVSLVSWSFEQFLFFFFFVLPSHQEIGAKKIKEEDIIRKEEKPHEYLSLS